jgi:hypothetical protein
MAALPGSSWGHNVGGFIRKYRPLGWLITGEAAGFVATLVDDTGRPLGRGGKPVRLGPVRSLDELAALIDEQMG